MLGWGQAILDSLGLGGRGTKVQIGSILEDSLYPSQMVITTCQSNKIGLRL